MKKHILISVFLVLFIGWIIRYVQINNGLSVHGEYPERVYGIHERIAFDDDLKSYNLYEQPGYSLSVENARIINTDEYLNELKLSPEFFSNLSEKYLELTISLSNDGDYPNNVEFYGFPVLGTNWYTFYDNEMTACINPFFNNDFDAAHGCAVRKGTTTSIKIAYNLFDEMFTDKQWDRIENEEMWVWVSIMPVDTKIKLAFQPKN